MLKRRAVLLAVWRLSPDPAVREIVEVELYGEADPGRAAAEADRLAEFAVLPAQPSNGACRN